MHPFFYFSVFSSGDKPRLTLQLPRAMRAANFTAEEIVDPAKMMALGKARARSIRWRGCAAKAVAGMERDRTIFAQGLPSKTGGGSTSRLVSGSAPMPVRSIDVCDLPEASNMSSLTERGAEELGVIKRNEIDKLNWIIDNVAVLHQDYIHRLLGISSERGESCVPRRKMSYRRNSSLVRMRCMNLSLGRAGGKMLTESELTSLLEKAERDALDLFVQETRGRGCVLQVQSLELSAWQLKIRKKRAGRVSKAGHITEKKINGRMRLKPRMDELETVKAALDFAEESEASDSNSHDTLNWRLRAVGYDERHLRRGYW